MSLILDGSNGITASGTNLTNAELGYLDGVTSNVQAQINNKAPLASPIFTGSVVVPTPTIAGNPVTKGYLETSGKSPDVRQTVLSGPVDITGVLNSLTLANWAYQMRAQRSW